MKNELHYFDIYPKVILNGEKSTITIKPLSAHVLFDDSATYEIHILEGLNNYGGDSKVIIKDIKSKDGIIQFSHTFKGEQEHILYVYEKESQKACLSVYSVEKDLYELRPYIGDLHVHTYLSDGKESPEFVMAEYRKGGFDFATVTDHERYHPSLRAIDAFKGVSIDMLIVEGEEVHTLDNFIHIINFGGDYSINELCRNDKDKYYKEVREILKEKGLEDNKRNFAVCASFWVFDKIKEANGLSIYCHPHWKHMAYQIPDCMTKMVFDSRRFDAFELIGGQSTHENNLQVAYYNSYMVQNGGKPIPVVGSSDSHGTINGTLFKRSKTIVFANSNEKEHIINAVRDGRSVAMQKAGDDYECYGSYRLVSFARFLINEYFPIHSELCFEEGLAMHSFIRKEENSAERLEFLKGRTAKLLEKYFG